MIDLLANATQDIVIMHQLGLPAGTHPGFSPTENVITEMDAWLTQKIRSLEKQGITRNRLIFDPGIGFGKSPAQSLTILKHINTFKKHEVRLLVGHSRKSFLANLTPYPAKERDIETAAMAPFLNQHGVDFLRVHNVDLCARVLRITSALAP
jgi:dihydropteroate synthase